MVYIVTVGQYRTIYKKVDGTEYKQYGEAICGSTLFDTHSFIQRVWFIRFLSNFIVSISLQLLWVVIGKEEVIFIDDPNEKIPVVIKYKGQGKDVSLAASFIKNWDERVLLFFLVSSNRFGCIEVGMIYILYKWFQRKEITITNSLLMVNGK